MIKRCSGSGILTRFLISAESDEKGNTDSCADLDALSVFAYTLFYSRFFDDFLQKSQFDL